jgi:Haem-binding domain
MRPWIKKALYVIVLVLLVAQLFPPARTNPSVDPSRTIHAALTIEPTVASALTRACNDCHSNQTVWPWYSKVAPASWLVVSDVRRGRAALNLSDWKVLSPEKQRELPSEICKEVAEREMPTEEYLLMHPRAKLTRTEIDSICRWAHSVQPATEQAARE